MAKDCYSARELRFTQSMPVSRTSLGVSFMIQFLCEHSQDGIHGSKDCLLDQHSARLLSAVRCPDLPERESGGRSRVCQSRLPTVPPDSSRNCQADRGYRVAVAKICLAEGMGLRRRDVRFGHG